jgi:tetratricopeptide (TPR) repeat protein
MSRQRTSTAERAIDPERAAPTPELMLRKATLARSAGLRAKYARRGLEHDGALDRTTRAMLLRQLYLSHMEARRFAEALDVAEKMVETGVMPDVARQDAARACLGLAERDQAIVHLRLASRVSPPSRRAFHLWTLGSVLHLSGRHREAIGALTRAARWGTTDKPLYLGQLALARLAMGDSVPDLDELRERLADAPCGQGYGQYVLGELAFEAGDLEAAKRYLRAFVKRSSAGRVALQVALAGELARSRRLLARIYRLRAKKL